MNKHLEGRHEKSLARAAAESIRIAIRDFPVASIALLASQLLTAGILANRVVNQEMLLARDSWELYVLITTFGMMAGIVGEGGYRMGRYYFIGRNHK